METFEQQLKRHEGGHYLTPYLDSEGNWTIAWGHLMKDGLVISRRVAQVLFDEDLHVAKFSFTTLGLTGLSQARQDVLINMLFNLGLKRFHSFKKMLRALEQHDYETAADEMLDSRWARQVKERATELAKTMRNGG